MYTATNPSPRYQQLLGYYSLMHKDGFDRRAKSGVINVPPSEAFSGRELTRFVFAVRGIIRAKNSKTILDYGSGKGRQYSEELKRDGKKLASSIHDFWNVREIACYDPAISKSQYPEDRKFDGVIATNVIDHIPEEDIRWVLDRLFAHSNQFVFCNVANFLAPTWLPSGENARVTRKSKLWWSRLFEEANTQYPQQSYCLAVAELKTDKLGAPKYTTSYIHNIPGLLLPGSARKVTGQIRD